MSFFLIITIAFTAGAAVLIVKRRSQRTVSRSGRYRSPRAGLNLARPACLMGKSRRVTGGDSSALAGPIFLAVVVVVMVFWVAAAFFLPEGQTRTAMVSETRADAAFPEQYSSLAGPLSPESAVNPGRPGGMVQTEESAAASGGFLTAAARSMVPVNDSFLGQVGLLSGRAASRPQRASGQPEQAGRSAAKPNVVSALGQVGPALSDTTLSSPASTATVVAASQVVAGSAVAASSAPKPLTGIAAPSVTPPRSTDLKILNKMADAPSRAFTVHLSSFTDQANAERYRSKLIEAGEDATISQVMMEGRQWYRVMSGRFSSRTAAEAYGMDLKRRGLTAEAGHYLIKSLD